MSGGAGGIDFDDLPEIPEVAEDIVTDDFDYDVAFKLAFVGIGQGGGRIAWQFQDLGYGSVCAINTAATDLAQLPLPDNRKLDLGSGGAGKDPDVAAKQIATRTGAVYDLFKRAWGDGLDYTILCFGAGGGTGAGCWPTVADVARRYVDDQNRPARVGAIVALPRRGEGPAPARNALRVIDELRQRQISPLILVDNDEMGRVFAKTAIARFWDRCNRQIATLLHIFNRLAAQDSDHTTFDRQDLAVLLDAGIVAMGASPIVKYASPADVSEQVRRNLSRSLLVNADLATGKCGGCLFVCGPDEYAGISGDILEHGFESLSRMLSPGATVYRGVYQGTKPGFSCFVIVSGLDWPEAKLQQLRNT